MKAVKYYKYGSPDQLKIEDINKPTPGKNDVIVNVKAASLNSWDWDLLTGESIFIRMWGLTKPKYHIPGADVAGIVESIGTHVTKFKPGDRVFGDLCNSGWGGFAEYVAPEKAFKLIPKNLSFEDAAAIPQAGEMALQGLNDLANIKSGQKILINGAGGGVGSFAIQLAKNIGAEVTAVDSFEKLEFMKSLGADFVINFENEVYTKNGNQYDIILDNVSNRTLSEYKNSLTPNGIFIMVGGTTKVIFKTLILGPIISKFSSKKLTILPADANRNIDKLAEFVASGKIKSPIDRVFNLNQIADAYQRIGEGKSKGKIVIKISD